RRPRAGHHPVAADPLPLAPGRFLRGQGARRAPQRIRRSRRQDGVATVAASRGRAGVDAAAKDPAPEEAPPDQPIPARPAPRPKDAPRTMKDLREERQGKRAYKAKPPDNGLRAWLRLET